MTRRHCSRNRRPSAANADRGSRRCPGHRIPGLYHPWSRDMFLTELAQYAQRALFVARVGAQAAHVVGYIGYRVVIDEMHIVIVAVHPAWRRRGIARHLLCEAMEHARQAACTRRPWKCGSPIPGRSSCTTVWALRQLVPAPGTICVPLKML